jgi:hypothetical protein
VAAASVTVGPATSAITVVAPQPATAGDGEAGSGEGAGGLGLDAVARRWTPDWYPGLAFLPSPIRFSAAATDGPAFAGPALSYSPALPDRIRWATVSGAQAVPRAVVVAPAQAMLMADSARMEAQSFPVRWPWLMAEPLPPAVPSTATMGASPADGPR